jgi:hypothetical protein
MHIDNKKNPEKVWFNFIFLNLMKATKQSKTRVKITAIVLFLKISTFKKLVEKNKRSKVPNNKILKIINDLSRILKYTLIKSAK